MAKMRALIERYEKWLMVGLVVFLMVVFTFTGDMQDMFMGRGQSVAGADDLVGTFYVVPDKQVEITNARFAQGRQSLTILQDLTSGSGRRDVSVLQVWAHLILSAAAENEGIVISDRDLVRDIRRVLGRFMQDKAAYSELVRTRYGLNRKQFEEAVREGLAATRVRELYRDTYLVSPPATRTDLVERYAPGSFEYVDLSWAALDATKYLDVVEKEFDAEKDGEKLLKEYFESDPAVKADTQDFRHKRRYEFEILYSIHDRLTKENLAAAEEMFFKIWPEYSKEKNNDQDALQWEEGEDKKYWGLYEERLLKSEGRDSAGLLEKATQQIDEEDRKAKEEEEKKKQENKDEEPKDEEPKDEEPKDEEPEGDEPKDPANDPALAALREKRIKEAQSNAGFRICAERIDRELRLRRMMRLIHNEAYAHPEKSLSKIFDKLVAADSKDKPLCSKEPGKGLFVFRHLDKPLSHKQIEDLTDGDVEFGPNVAFRVSQLAREKLPAVRNTAEPMGTQGAGRMSLRVIAAERERRKTFPELSEGEKAILKDDFYLPHRARERAKKVLEELKKQFDEGKIKPNGFAAAAGSLGARVYENEHITAATRFMAPPDKTLLYPPEFQRMRDRHFLRSHLASLLAADRIKKEDERIKPGTWLDIELRTDADDEDKDPGTAYLALLIDREKPTAATMPEDNLIRARMTAERQGSGRDRERWSIRYQQLFSDFNVEFIGTMKDQVNEAYARIAEAERDRINLGQR
ncbi:MAG: SurA N-terminal domain-containing protein [Planctomycetota bacterium]|jgi:hypothetical protein